METKKILIAEPSVDFCSQLAGCITGAYDLRICHNGQEAKKLLETFQPDVAVVDLLLPELDGMGLVKYMEQLPCRPRTLLTTCLVNTYLETAVRSLSVDMVMVKPCDVRNVAERIYDLAQEKPEVSVFVPVNQDRLPDVLQLLGVSTKRKAFSYLEMGVELYTNNPCQAVTKKLYPEIAKIYDTNSVAVERAIRKAIHEAWENRDEAVWRQYFCINRSTAVHRPTNTEFISRLAEVYRSRQLAL
jgi:two-component system response regulator (stage 0 sporulation protein A)